MKAPIQIAILTLTLLASDIASADNIIIKDGKASSYQASAVGYGGKATNVVIVTVTLGNNSDQPVTLSWKDTVPVLETTGKRVEAARILIPNWLPMAGGVGPYSTETSFSGEVVSGIELDKNTWCGWLAVDHPGAQSGDHISIPVKSVTLTVTKDKPVTIKLFFPEDIAPANADLTLPGCQPSPFRLGANPSKSDVVPAKAIQPPMSAQSLPQNAEIEKLIVNACLADRPSLQGYTGVVNIKNTAPNTPENGKFTVHADVAFTYYGTRMTLGYIDRFEFSKDENNTWKVEIVKTKN